MPKQKTRKSITKRFRVTPKGKVLRRVSFRKHLNEKMSSRKKRQSRRMVATKKSYADRIKKMLGR